MAEAAPMEARSFRKSRRLSNCEKVSRWDNARDTASPGCRAQTVLLVFRPWSIVHPDYSRFSNFDSELSVELRNLQHHLKSPARRFCDCVERTLPFFER